MTAVYQNIPGSQGLSEEDTVGLSSPQLQSYTPISQGRGDGILSGLLIAEGLSIRVLAVSSVGELLDWRVYIRALLRLA